MPGVTKRLVCLHSGVELRNYAPLVITAEDGTAPDMGVLVVREAFRLEGGRRSVVCYDLEGEPAGLEPLVRS